MDPIGDIPIPEITWSTDQSDFKSLCDDLNFCNIWTFRSAAIRGDKKVTLQRVSQPNSNELVPEGFNPQKQESYLRRNIPLVHKYIPTGLKPSDSISKEVNVPYPSFENRSHPSKTAPLVYDKFKLTWLKELGKGGFGVAALYQVDFEDGFTMQVVIKRPVRESAFAFKDERRWHQKYQGAKNITQSLDLNKIAKDHSKTSYLSAAFGKKYDHSDNIVLDYMEHGSLGQLNHNLAYLENHVKWSNHALWQLFSGLVRGLAEMAYNKSYLTKGDSVDSFLKTMKSLSPQQREEKWQSLALTPMQHDVHFDLEDSNILVGRDPDNGNVIFKLHDFSDYHSHDMAHAWKYWDLESYWYKRYPVKPGRNLPEQHATEWDSIPKAKVNPIVMKRFTGDRFTPENSRVAGRYGMWSNVFSIAKAVECCVTMYIHTHPFQAKEGTIEGQARSASFGWRLFDHPEQGNLYPNADPCLRKLLTLCMQEDPALRPGLVQLLRECYAAEEAGFMEYDDATNDFWWAATNPREYGEANGLGSQYDEYENPPEELGQPFWYDNKNPQDFAAEKLREGDKKYKPYRPPAHREVFSFEKSAQHREPFSFEKPADVLEPSKQDGQGSGDQPFGTAPSVQRDEGKGKAPAVWKSGSKRRAADLEGEPSGFAKKRATNRGPFDVPPGGATGEQAGPQIQRPHPNLNSNPFQRAPAAPPQVQWRDHTGLSEALTRQMKLFNSGGRGAGNN